MRTAYSQSNLILWQSALISRLLKNNALKNKDWLCHNIQPLLTNIYHPWQCPKTRITKQMKRLARFSERRVHLTSLGRWRKWFDCRMQGTLSLARCFDWSESPGRGMGITFICHILMTSNLFKFSLYSWLRLISPCGQDPGGGRAEIGLFL